MLWSAFHTLFEHKSLARPVAALLQLFSVSAFMAAGKRPPSKRQVRFASVRPLPTLNKSWLSYSKVHT